MFLELRYTLAGFPANMVAGCEAAIDAEVFNQNDFRDFVVKHMGGFGCEPAFVEMVDFPPDYNASIREINEALSARIKVLPRGHYAVIHHLYRGSGPGSYSAIMADGTGHLATGGSHDSYSEPPLGEKVRERMVGYEIYECRGLVEAKRAREADVAALAKHGFKVGQEFKNYRHLGETKRYSKAVIEATYPETGRLKLLLTRRGSPKRWNAECGAKWFAEETGVAVREPEKHPFIVVKKIGEDLFA